MLIQFSLTIIPVFRIEIVFFMNEWNGPLEPSEAITMTKAALPRKEKRTAVPVARSSSMRKERRTALPL